MTVRYSDGNKRTTLHFTYALIFFTILFVSIAMIVLVSSQADDTTETVTITNAVPTLDTVTISESSYGESASAVTLSENTTKVIYVWGQASDANGCEEISDQEIYGFKFYRGDKAFSCSADNNDCYTAPMPTVDQCTPGGSDTSVRYQYTVTLQYYADSTDDGSPFVGTNWIAEVVVGATHNTATTEINSLIALSVDASIDYGTLALGATSSSDQVLNITNTGNRNMDANVKADGNMICTTIGSINVGQVKYSLTPAFNYASAGTALTTSDVNSNNSTAQRTNDSAASITPVFFKVSIPSTGVAGVCSNTITWTAVADV